MKITLKTILIIGMTFFGFLSAKAEVSDSQQNVEAVSASALNKVFDNYFELKDALVKTDAKAAGSKAASLLSALNSVNEKSLSSKEIAVWKKLKNAMVKNTENISKSKNIADQRAYFKPLSEDFYALAKEAKYSQTLYYQYCPMYDGDKGAKWLSKEKNIRNPFFGDRMMACGRVVDTLN